MTQRNELYDIEKRVARTFGAGTSRPVPPFADVAARLAAGEPRESFEEFFGGEASPVPVTALPSRGRSVKTATGRPVRMPPPRTARILTGAFRIPIIMTP